MYDRMTMQEAVGEAPWQQGGYEPSHVFLASDLREMDDDELDVVRHITERDAARTMDRLEAENRRLRERIAELESDADGDDRLDEEEFRADVDREGGEDSHLDAQYEDRFDTGLD